MESKIIEIENNNIDLIIESFYDKFLPEGIYNNENKNIFAIFFEKFSFLTKSDLSGTVIFDRMGNNKCKIIIIISRGGSGFFRLAYGSESRAMNKITKFIDSLANDKSIKKG